MTLKYLIVVLCIFLPGCLKKATHQAPYIICQQFATAHHDGFNVDSVALWHGSVDQHWLIATAKTAHTLPVYDAATGAFIKTIGTPGKGIGQLQRPNGIAILDDFLFIVERDNKRLQIFNVPEGNSVGMINDLQLPYGIAAYTIKKNKQYMLYVTENAGPRKGKTPKKVHQYQANFDGKKMHLSLVRIFGDQEGAGALWKVESIAVDPHYNRLFIADEHPERNNVKIYTLDGTFTGQTIGDGLIASEPEGIALYEHGDQGYLVVTDQDKENNIFWIFDRVTLQPITCCKGALTLNTDGIAITKQSFGPFNRGAFYAVHDDGSVHAYDWESVCKACGLSL